MKKLSLFMLMVVCATMSYAQAKETVAILGDSYSTYEGYLTPSTNEIWYFQPWRDKRTDVNDVKQTWWWQVIDRGGFKLGVNNSYSGSTICNTGYNDEDYTARSFVTRYNNLGTPDIIFVFGGTNDSWANVPVGEFKYENIRRADLFTFRPAMAYLMQGLINHYPGARIYVLINNELSEEVTNSMKTIADRYGIPYIQLKDIDKKGGHPSIKGMSQIADQILKVIKK
ncbi:MAG: hypothetical protein IJR71_05040 [Prevotella sp.]|nr:hypothetical protein [Prevotella sp.]